MTLIELKNIRKSYHLDGFDLEILILSFSSLKYPGYTLLGERKKFTATKYNNVDKDKKTINIHCVCIKKYDATFSNASIKNITINIPLPSRCIL